MKPLIIDVCGGKVFPPYGLDNAESVSAAFVGRQHLADTPADEWPIQEMVMAADSSSEQADSLPSTRP